MALEGLQARPAARIPTLDHTVARRRGQPGRVVREGHRVDPVAMALEGLQTRPATYIPDPDRAVAGRRRQPGRVVRKGHGVDPVAMALERLQARAPAVAHTWLNSNPLR